MAAVRNVLLQLREIQVRLCVYVFIRSFFHFADTINKAFSMICNKFQDDMQQLPNSVPKPPITMRLIVPATQCGSLIGKGGRSVIYAYDE